MSAEQHGGQTRRAADLRARYGEELFVVLLESGAHSVSELESNSDTVEDLIGRADEALCLAKGAGRNRIVVLHSGAGGPEAGAAAAA